jgi:hypothetical protein
MATIELAAGRALGQPLNRASNKKNGITGSTRSRLPGKLEPTAAR